MAKIETLEQLRALYKKPGERALRKQLDFLDPHSRRFIELSPFMLLSSNGIDGPADVTPRGGEPGFVHCLDDRHLAIPDSPGNNRLDTMTNIIGNPEVAAIFLVPGVDETLRLNGTAEIRDDAELRERFAVGDRLPVAVIVIEVRDVYLHCAKALMRGRIWDQDARVARSALPTMGQMLKDQIGLDGPAETQETMVARYRAQLY